MAHSVQMWRDSRGFLHDSEAAAENADSVFEREKRRRVVHAMLVAEIKRAETMITTSAQLADWLITSWPTLRAIGFAYRVHEFAPQGEAAVTTASDAA